MKDDVITSEQILSLAKAVGLDPGPMGINNIDEITIEEMFSRAIERLKLVEDADKAMKEVFTFVSIESSSGHKGFINLETSRSINHARVIADHPSLKSALETLVKVGNLIRSADGPDDMCCCGEPMDCHPIMSNHTPVSMAERALDQRLEEQRMPLEMTRIPIEHRRDTLGREIKSFPEPSEATDMVVSTIWSGGKLDTEANEAHQAFMNQFPGDEPPSQEALAELAEQRMNEMDQLALTGTFGLPRLAQEFASMSLGELIAEAQQLNVSHQHDEAMKKALRSIPNHSLCRPTCSVLSFLGESLVLHTPGCPNEAEEEETPEPQEDGD